MSSTLKQAALRTSGISSRAEFLKLGIFALERSQAYWLLSRLFLKAPDASHLHQLQNDLASVFEPGPLDELRNEVDSCLAEPAAAVSDFKRQLLAMTGADDREPPFESFVREGRVPGVATDLVAACMGEAGFSDIAHDAPSPDHLGIELRFMAIQCYEEGQAWTAGRHSEGLRLVVTQRDFLLRHLAAWAPEYCERLEERAGHSYVRAVARLTRRCLIAEVAAVEALFLRMSAAEPYLQGIARHRRIYSH